MKKKPTTATKATKYGPSILLGQEHTREMKLQVFHSSHFNSLVFLFFLIFFFVFLSNSLSSNGLTKKLHSILSPEASYLT